MSFTNDDILVLARAGFTSQQISALNSVQPTQPTTLDIILSAIQQSALHQTEQPNQPTTDDILAEIINPPTK